MSAVLDQIQIALFPNNFKILSPSSLGADLIDKDFISGKNLVINSFLTDTSPGEIVRIEALLKEDVDIQLKIAQTKVSFYFTNPSSSGDFKVEASKIEDLINRINKLFLKGQTFNRVGYITTTFKIVENPISFFKGKVNFVSDKDLKDVKAQLTFTTDFDTKEWSDIEFNKYLELGTGYLINDPDQKTVVLQYDLNVRQDQNPEWNIEDVVKFIKKANSRQSDPDSLFAEVFGE
jgi:hypothetical protein